MCRIRQCLVPLHKCAAITSVLLEHSIPTPNHIYIYVTLQVQLPSSPLATINFLSLSMCLLRAFCVHEIIRLVVFWYFVTGIWGNVFKVHLCWCTCKHHPFRGCITFHCVDILHLAYSSIWGLFPFLAIVNNFSGLFLVILSKSYLLDRSCPLVLLLILSVWP